MVIKLCKHNQNNVLDKIRKGQLDTISLSTTNLIDDIILEMSSYNVLDCLKQNIPDLRGKNNVIPYELIWASAICAKMKIRTSLTDIPFAISDHRTLAKLGYTLIDSEGSLKHGLMQEGSLRFLLNKYDYSLFINGYNDTVQKGIMPLFNIESNIHILDCTDLEVNYYNENYENSGIGRSKKDGKSNRGYKLATLRGIIDDIGIIEDIRFGSIDVHDLNLSEEMLRTSPMLKEGDILICDRGFISRDLVNYLKTDKKVDTYIPLRKNMEAFEAAVMNAQIINNWKPHPNKKRKYQYITLIEDLGENWTSKKSKDDVPINACVVWDKKENDYFVFVTTDITKGAKGIIITYELRPEIEEDYRQLKDFWKIEDFKSTKINVILFHIVCVLFGYLFYQLYTLLPKGESYLGKSLPVIIKNYVPQVQAYIILYVGFEFAILTLFEVLELYTHCNEYTKKIFKKVLEGENK
ncbi:MAG: transposase [Hungatella sp.]|jgi:uncharacterized protein with PQ loop repeat|nr:transposase [Hungatella sp.]